MFAFSLSDRLESDQGFRLTGGRFESFQGIAELRQALLMLFSTRPGERALRPEFGCPLDRLAFEPNDATTAGMAIRLVSDAITRHEPRAFIVHLDAGPDPVDPACLRIDLDYQDRRNNATDQLTLSLPLDRTA